MGMAASQARYLALVARKSNCEYEGQQINQARTVLSNQSANLFNQMLGLSVPVPPSTQDYTKMQYSFTDGVNEYTIDNWNQLAKPEEDYNYVVTTHSYVDIYTGAQRKLPDPQVQFSSGQTATVDEIENAMRLLTQRQAEWDDANAALAEIREEAANLYNYENSNMYTRISASSYNTEDNAYTVTYNIPTLNNIGRPTYQDSTGTRYYLGDDGNYYSDDGNDTKYTGTETLQAVLTPQEAIFTGYNKLSEDDQTTVQSSIQALIDLGALEEDVAIDYADVYYNAADGTIAFRSDLRTLYGGTSGGSQTILPAYVVGDEATEGTIQNITSNYTAQIAAATETLNSAISAYQEAERYYESLDRPTYVGNCELDLIVEPTSDQMAELRQIITDMRAQGIDDSISACFNEQGEYIGGIYSFKMNGTTYYTTFADLSSSYASGDGINNIDHQNKLNYYNASYVSTKQEETKKALLETDGNGRFTSVRFEDDSVTYTLNMETITDDNAYKDAMNEYYYASAQYDKMVQDINAKTSLIQQEDQQLELRLKQLDTEQNALSTEIDAVSKVVKDNVEDSFKTFGG